ncbi:MAG: TAXI family TRAP transporter solute-binding subunit [gamma proteobacterium symbiont of Bathyaustriella thionipta]|nr:TAXI family TRAP transporter solute-binding subunit [gamma proteobacterium symbiont of Bathyaustriella thionipta]
MIHKRAWLFLLLMTVIMLSACKSGPDTSVLKQDLQSRLDSKFSDGLFKVQSFTRKGSAPAPGKDEDIYIYYDAELEFQRNYNLAAWQGLNLGTLAVVLGAKPAGIEGYKQNNQQGDLLTVRGRLSYSQNTDGWKNINLVPQTKLQQAAAPVALKGPGSLAVLESVRRLLKRNPQSNDLSQDGIILEELERSLQRIDLRLARRDGKLPFGTGWKDGTYNRFGKAFSSYAIQHGLPVFNFSSEGSIDNGLQLQQGELDFALLQSDVAEVLYKGWIDAAQLPLPDLRSMASLWPEALHIVTLAGRNIHQFSDLQNKHLAIGSPGSGTRYTARRVWQAAGYDRPSIEQIRSMGLPASIAALESGDVDAIFVTGAIPEPTLQALAQRRNDVRLVPVDEAIIKKLSGQFFSYYGTWIPAKTYQGQEKPYRTLGFAALLVTTKNVSDEHVEKFLDLVVSSANELTHKFYRTGFISTETSRLGISIPLHPGAERFYEKLSQQQDSVQPARQD